MRIVAAVAALFLIAAEPLPAPDAPLPDPAQEARAQALFEEIRCVVCQHESVADSPAGLAADVRAEVRGRIAAGATDDQIRAGLVERWGDFVLFRPPFDPGTLLLWLGPLALLLAGAGLAVARARKPAPEPTPLSPAEEAALAKALKQDRLRHEAAADAPDGRR
ncbi:MAG TPA: cytochrome c-type biogenesis protein [Brevundimonas sp.]|jgi:cytochrome c-type biogenesis protein CcmH|uniref:cytochrome c-type biogenesis protein n=1 Tax=Brevundimonas sp. TaxID=1871086 RepID=UPI002DED5601|nr:cytochrome c-type biogenesis protein [Brevundimonas sp.]